MKTHIAKITVSVRKGHTQDTLWAVRHNRPYPDITSSGSSLEWRNAGSLIPSYRTSAKVPALESSFTCDLFRSDFDESTAKGTRLDHAGFEPGLVYDPATGQRIQTPANPGAIELRGKTLGEMRIEFGVNPDWPDIKVRGFDSPTSSEREWIKTHIVPSLRAYITANAASLRAHAIADLQADIAKRLAEARAQLDAMEKQAAECIAKL